MTVGGVTTLYTVSPTKLLSLTDIGAASTYTTLATAGTNTAFRGVDFAPSSPNMSPAPEPGEMAVLSLCGLGLGGVLLRRRMKKTAVAAV